MIKKWTKKQLIEYINSNSSFIYVETEFHRFSCKMYIDGNLLPIKATGLFNDLETKSLNLLNKLLDNRFMGYVTYAYNKEHKLNKGNLWLFMGYL